MVPEFLENSPRSTRILDPDKEHVIHREGEGEGKGVGGGGRQKTEITLKLRQMKNP